MEKHCLKGLTRFALTPIISTLLFTHSIFGQVSILLFEVPYTENFNTLALSDTSSSLPQGWALAESGSNMNSTYAAGTGSGNTGNTYSFGSTGSTERAFGGLQSGSLIPTIGGSFTNNTGDVIRSLNIGYTGEQWRLGALGRVDQIDFQYSTNATSLISGTWFDVNSLDFVAPVTTGSIGALNGNISPNRTLIEATITNLSIPNGSTFWIRWNDLNASGADDGLSVDDFSIAACSDALSCSVLPIQLLQFSVVNSSEHIRLNWSTSIEINNDMFEVQRSNDSESGFLPIGTVESASNLRTINNYEFIDQSPSTGNNYYRLKQYDLDGKFTYSPIRSIVFGENHFKISISPNPGKNYLLVKLQSIESMSEILLFDQVGRVLVSKKLEVGQTNSYLSVHDVPDGIYTIVVQSGYHREVRRVMISN